MDAERRRGRGDIDRLLDGVKRRPLSRRRFIQAAGIGPAAAFLAACTRRIGGPAPRRSPASTAAELEDTLVIYNWAAYLNPETVKAFEREYDVTVQATDFYESNEEMIAKLQGGATGYDLVAPTGYAVEILANEGLLLELDHSRLPNLANVEDRFTALSFDPEMKYHAPKDWGTTGFGYLGKFVKEDLTSWEGFFGSGGKYSGRYTVLDGPYEVVSAGLKRLGYSWNSTSQSEVDEALELLIDFKPHIRAITSTQYRQMMSRAETWLALGWNGDFFYVYEDQPSVRYVIPSEGTEFWVDTWAIPASAPHPNLAHEFINWILTPERQGVESSYTYYASCVEGAKEFTDEAVANDPNIYPPAEVTDKLEATSGDPEALQLRVEAWRRFQAAAS
ncbi:MAG TPA: spermidine/putrescine ABC transporter substrate-binding protein [Actinomycetota bacterium]|nr:spermidine/putrescine ABC transporter substrate-binding protein [Actinomycetota bacterium]